MGNGTNTLKLLLISIMLCAGGCMSIGKSIELAQDKSTGQQAEDLPSTETVTTQVETTSQTLSVSITPSRDVQPSTPTQFPTPSSAVLLETPDFPGKQKDDPLYIEFRGKVTVNSGNGEVFFRGDEARFIDVNQDCSNIRLLDLETYKEVGIIDYPLDSIDAIIPDSTGKQLAIVSTLEEKILFWDLETYKIKSTLPLNGFAAPFPDWSHITGDFSYDDRYFAIAGCTILGQWCLQSTILIFDTATWQVIEKLEGYQLNTYSLSFSPKEYLIVAAGEGESILKADILIWDVENNRELARIQAENPPFFGASFSPNLETLASLMTKETLPDRKTHLLLWKFDEWENPYYEKPTTAYSFGMGRHDRVWLITIERELNIIRFRDGITAQTFQYIKTNPHSIILSASIHPNGKYMYILVYDFQIGSFVVQTWEIRM